jgi:Protein of unknown function, DUF547
MLLWIVAAYADAGPFDQSHAQLASVLRGAVSDAGVDYALLATRREELRTYLTGVAEADLAGWSSAQKLAFYVNAYNALTVALILDSGQPKSIMDLDGGKVWTTRRFQVAGQSLTLDQIENQRARPLSDGRVHAVLNCASRGCPPLPPAPLVAATSSAQLDEGARRWARINAYRITGETVALSSVFDWYGEDFASERKGDLPKVDGDAESALWFLSRFVDPAVSAILTSGTLTATWAPYDWSLNRK